MTIGPHQGKELELMLTGTKKLAAFGDIIPEVCKISEIIIPEKAFAPHVEKGTLIRLENQTEIPDTNNVMHHVCFTAPNEQWRAKTYIGLRKQIFLNTLKYEDSHDWIFGRLLGYSAKDIQHFLDNQNKRRRSK